ncbi:MAG: DNA-binding transcriptional regulator [Opitutae bacterium]|nr:DNA-binding transcriptional regulator [Opitutae bacterium]
MTPPKRVAIIVRTQFEVNQSVLRGIAQFEQRHGPWLAFVDEQAVSVQEPDWLFDQRWDGVICGPTTLALARRCRRLRIPLVDLRDHPEIFANIPKVRPDNIAIGHLGAEHLLEKGHAHFGFCGFANTSWARERRRGFVEAVKLAGKQCHILETDYPGAIAPDWDNAQEKAILGWLRHLPRPLAVMACNDLRAIQVINACQRAGIVVPEEIAVLGANNQSARCELCHPSLSSIAVDAMRIGYRAAELLHAAMSAAPPKATEELVEPLHVVARRSTDALAIADPKIARALHYINEHACQGLTVDDVVREVHVSRSVLERKFRDHLRRSPQAAIRYAQVQRAKALLADTDASVAEIAEATSIEHPEYLCVVFKRITGETPRSYRERARHWKKRAS